jgi:hypothetical protein
VRGVLPAGDQGARCATNKFGGGEDARMERVARLTTLTWGLVRENKRAYVVLNILYYGLIFIFMGVAALNPGLQDELLRTTTESVTSGPLAMAGEAYINGEVLKAMALTFVVNLFIGSLAFMTLPSMIVPFLGLLSGVYRAIVWGLIFYPGHRDMRIIMIPHSLTLLLEGQAYILVMLAAWLHGRAFLFPKSAGFEGHWNGYVEGLKQTGKIYFLVVLVLLAAAVYEAIEVIWIAKWMG